MKKVNDPGTTATNQMRTRRKVTTCLYRSPNNRARLSLSTLMAVDVKIVISVNKGRKIFNPFEIIEENEKKLATDIGCTRRDR